MSAALWWYSLKREENRLVMNPAVTSFNARNLQSPLWRDALRTRRGVVLATELGEAKGSHQYLMRARRPIALAMLYRDWPDGSSGAVRSTALITRPPHPRYSRYHDKSIPLMLPLTREALTHWLDPEIEDSPQIQQWLEAPQLTEDFEVVPVKSYKRGEAVGEAEVMPRDPPDSEVSS